MNFFQMPFGLNQKDTRFLALYLSPLGGFLKRFSTFCNDFVLFSKRNFSLKKYMCRTEDVGRQQSVCLAICAARGLILCTGQKKFLKTRYIQNGKMQNHAGKVEMKSRSLQVLPCPHQVTCSGSVCMCVAQRSVCCTGGIPSYVCSVPLSHHSFYVCSMVYLIASMLTHTCLSSLAARDTWFHRNRYSVTCGIQLSKLNSSQSMCVLFP